jgi:hypothetical protein
MYSIRALVNPNITIIDLYTVPREIEKERFLLRNNPGKSLHVCYLLLIARALLSLCTERS